MHARTKSRKNDPERMRSKIFDAAADLFQVKGYNVEIDSRDYGPQRE